MISLFLSPVFAHPSGKEIKTEKWQKRGPLERPRKSDHRLVHVIQRALRLVQSVQSGLFRLRPQKLRACFSPSYTMQRSTARRKETYILVKAPIHNFRWSNNPSVRNQRDSNTGTLFCCTSEQDKIFMHDTHQKFPRRCTLLIDALSLSTPDCTV